ncbi:MAG: ferredoxin [Chitinispirillaceae bacterium]|nr:ferredoxin [Chitinispirillaceae bacterium]
MKAIIDRETCIGCGICVETCPEVFELDNEGKARVKTEVVPPGNEESCGEAAVDCPVAAITVE